MEKSGKQLFTCSPLTGLYEYLLVARPDVEVGIKIQKEMQAFYDQYGNKAAITTQPRITVANFSAREDMEDILIRYIQRICSRQQSFEVALNNYSGYASHTIFLRVQNCEPFRQLANELQAISSYIGSYSYPPVKAIKTPHVSIARKLPENIYLKALIDYGQKTFHEKFIVNELTLLRRNQQYDSCKSINIFGLQPAEKNLYN